MGVLMPCGPSAAAVDKDAGGDLEHIAAQIPDAGLCAARRQAQKDLLNQILDIILLLHRK
jgi:hypothetical protein